jgi:hypothetical protein
MANTTSSMATTTPFLDVLPPELRTHIYTYLLVTPLPLKGLTARRSTQYDIHTAILRTNKQIYSEARHVFLGRNTFSVTSVPPVLIPSSSDESDEGLGSGAFEPPLQLKDLHLVRHLSIDLLYSYPHAVSKTANTGAQRYITNVSYLLSHLSPSMVKSLKITADTTTTTTATSSSSLSSSPISTSQPDALNIRTFLLPFHFADLTPRFSAAIACLTLDKIDLRFDFADMYFDFQVPRDVAGRGGLVGFAGQVLVKRGEIALRGISEDLGCEEQEEEEEEEEEGDEAVGKEKEVLEYEDERVGQREGTVVCDWVC